VYYVALWALKAKFQKSYKAQGSLQRELFCLSVRTASELPETPRLTIGLSSRSVWSSVNKNIPRKGWLHCLSSVLKLLVMIRGVTFPKHAWSGWPITTHGPANQSFSESGPSWRPGTKYC